MNIYLSYLFVKEIMMPIKGLLHEAPFAQQPHTASITSSHDS